MGCEGVCVCGRVGWGVCVSGRVCVSGCMSADVCLGGGGGGRVLCDPSVNPSLSLSLLLKVNKRERVKELQSVEFVCLLAT